MANGYFHQLSKLLQVVDCLAKPQGVRLKELQNAFGCDE